MREMLIDTIVRELEALVDTQIRTEKHLSKLEPREMYEIRRRLAEKLMAENATSMNSPEE